MFVENIDDILKSPNLYSFKDKIEKYLGKNYYLYYTHSYALDNNFEHTETFLYGCATLMYTRYYVLSPDQHFLYKLTQ